MAERLIYLDAARGLAVGWMVFTQLWDMYCREFCYATAVIGNALRWMSGGRSGSFSVFDLSWLGLFLVVAGFTLKLGWDRYDAATFVRKTFMRSIRFVAVGVLLLLWLGFALEPFSEVVSSIGINLLLLVPFLFVFQFQRGLVQVFAFTLSSLAMAVWNAAFRLPWLFDPFMCLSFMLFGVALATVARGKNRSPLFILLVIGLIVFRDVFWLLNALISALIFAVARFMESTQASRVLAYFGRHAFFFYFFHFAIFDKLLHVSDLRQTFPAPLSLILATASLGILVLLEKSYHHLPLSPNAKLYLAKVGVRI